MRFPAGHRFPRGQVEAAARVAELGRHWHEPTARVALAWLLARPGLLLQRLTTREPDDAQVEVAIAAMKGALSLDGETA